MNDQLAEALPNAAGQTSNVNPRPHSMQGTAPQCSETTSEEDAKTNCINVDSQESVTQSAPAAQPAQCQECARRAWVESLKRTALWIRLTTPPAVLQQLQEGK